MTKIFLDTEFTGLHQKTTLISIGLVTESGETFYAEFTDYDQSQIDPWIEFNVLDNLTLINKWDMHDELPTISVIKGDRTKREVIGTTIVIKYALMDWLSHFKEVEIWSDCLAYDWVLFNELFGGALNIPKNTYYIPFDICTLFKIKEIDPDINREDYSKMPANLQGTKHNALHDAQVIKRCYEKAMM